MDENLRFIALIDSLKEKGLVNDYVQIAKELDTNKAAISDIKAGRKKLSIDLLRRLKKSYPSCSIEWVVTGEGNPFITPQSSSSTSSSQNTELFLNRIAEQAEEIGRLKARIEELERERSVHITPQYARSTSKETVET